MKIIYTIRLLVALIGLSVVTLGLSSCKKENDTKSDAVEMLSFGPTGVKPGQDIRIIGNNLDKITAVEFVGASVEMSAFKEQTPELIILTVPLSAERGAITLKSPLGDIVSKSSFDMEVPVVISSVPATVKPGENMTIKGEYLNWVTGVRFAKDTLVTEFISRSMTELVVHVPMTAETGSVVFLTSGTVPLEIITEMDLIVTLPAITGFSPVSVERESNLTIRGTNLDLAEGVLLPGIKDPIMSFVSKTPEEIVLTVPKDAKKGKISLKAYSGVMVESANAIEIVGDLPPLDALGLVLYDDEVKNGWSKWGGWGSGSLDMASTENVRDGLKSIKVTFAGGYGGTLQMGGGSATAGYTEFRFSIFGTPGTNGKKMKVIVKGGTKEEHEVSVVEGEWTEYRWTIAGDLGAPDTIKEFILQDNNWSGTIFIDHIGLK